MIVEAKMKHLPQLTKLGHIQTTQIQGFAFDWYHCEQNVAAWIELSILHPNTHYLGIVEADDGSCIGYLNGRIGQHFWNTDLVATVEYWFSLESGLKLLKDFEAWAKKNGATEITMGFSNPDRLQRLPKRWLESAGWNMDTIHYRKDLMHV